MKLRPVKGMGVVSPDRTAAFPTKANAFACAVISSCCKYVFVDQARRKGTRVS